MNKKQLICMWIGIVCIVLFAIPFACNWLSPKWNKPFIQDISGVILIIFCMALVTIGFITTFKSKQKS